MTLLSNNTILSNFSTVARPDLVQAAFPTDSIATVQAVLREHAQGVATEHFPYCDWSWLTVLDPAPEERNDAEQFAARLGRGEADCLAVATARGMRFATDDREARKFGIPITGTVGILTILVKDGKITIAEADTLLAKMIAAGFRSPFASVKRVLDT